MNDSFPRFDRAATYKQKPPLLRVSFEFIDWETDLFFLHGFDAEFYVRLFTCLQTIQTCTVEQMSKRHIPGLGCKAIFKTDTGSRDAFPRRIVARIATMLSREQGSLDPEQDALHIVQQAFEVSMGKNQGRLHGFLWNTAFNLVWFDPAHNLYPGNQRIRGPRDVMQIKTGSHEQLLRLKDENAALVTENDRLAREFEELLSVWAEK
ncbi:hypothetical protein ACFJIX_20220 [Roseateles sp. UC29_93]|uniref:hypothetical protein n=1 Tax=Roseateles sp. UC29_93 TaxID=3350177 RepID=UPI003672B95E